MSKTEEEKCGRKLIHCKRKLSQHKIENQIHLFEPYVIAEEKNSKREQSLPEEPNNQGKEGKYVNTSICIDVLEEATFLTPPPFGRPLITGNKVINDMVNNNFN